MPRTILVRPGGARKRYSVRQKLQILKECSRLRREDNLSLRGAAALVGIAHSLLVKWTKDVPRLTAYRRERDKGKKSINDGPTGQLDCIKDDLLLWIFARREQGIAVTKAHVVYKASAMLLHQDNAFKDKSFEARFKAVSRWLAKYEFVYKRRMKPRGPPMRCARRPPHSWPFIAPLFAVPIVIRIGSLTWTRRRCTSPTTAPRLSRNVELRPYMCASQRRTRGELRAH